MDQFHDLSELLGFAVEWEERLSGYYREACAVIEDLECRELVEALQKKHLDNLEILKSLRLEDYGKEVWIQCDADCNIDDILPREELLRQPSAGEITGHILEFEERIRRYYSLIAEKILYRGERDFVESLERFKEMQIDTIHRYCSEIL